MIENIIGFLRYPVELHFTPSVKAIAHFDIYDTPHGGYKSRYRIIAWEALAEACNESLYPSSKVFIKGKKKQREYTTSEGETKYYKEVTAYRIFELDDTPQEMPNAREIRPEQ